LKNRIEKLVNDALAALPPGTLGDGELRDPAIERSRDSAHGDFATGVAMRLAKAARTNPRKLAEKIVALIPANDFVAKTEVAGPGFINFFMTPAAWQAEMSRVLAEGAGYGRGGGGAGSKAIVEFVSANPTGPLHVGHGRHAAFGATVANLLEADGWQVHREYYVNDAGRQMDILAASVWLRYLELLGETLPFPANGYRGEYVRPVAAPRTTTGRPARDRTIASGAVYDAEVPAINGVFTARSLARMYAAISLGGTLDGVKFLSPETITRAGTVRTRARDIVIGWPMRWRLGYHMAATTRGVRPRGFGHFGLGGSGAWADPDLGLSVAMTCNRMAGTPFGDQRLLRVGAAAVKGARSR